jgi:hypothetical protein
MWANLRAIHKILSNGELLEIDMLGELGPYPFIIGSACEEQGDLIGF